ncbi:outer membrane beta-barrel protein [Jiulongibacter sediminis]|uniref:outer membrane beta-barrel protein n=1 Tax=Jiulongibacter sediminis TaxID=1605367 RepID=UPI0026EAC40D|nr:outer membrane beta-barrel protein [Jiulongibacter sediminis]
MKKLLLLTFTVMLSAMAKAQQTGTVKGTVLDESSVAMPFSNILLLSTSDSSLVKATASDMDGAFALEDLKMGSYFVKISMVGYQDFNSPKFQLSDAQPDFQFQPLKLQLNTNELAEVTVTAKKPFIEQQVDRTVVNVENSIVSSGNTALEVLEKAPGVTIDRQNDALKLKNKNGVQIMIDGRLSYLSNEALMQMLSNMTSDQISSIEIITNPSSKYDASGNSGIINIKLKKNKAFGTNGTFSVSVGDAYIPNSTDDLYRASSNLSLNHRNEKVNVFGNLNVGRNTWYNDNTLIRSTNFEGLRSEFDQSSKRFGKGFYTSGKLGMDYFASDKTTFGIMLDANNWNGSMVNTGLTEILEISEGNQVRSSLEPYSNRDMDNWNVTGNFNIKHNFNDKGKEVTFDADYSGFRNYGFQAFNTAFYDADGQLTNNLIQQNTTPSDIDIYAAKVDFVIPTESKVKIEFGAKTSYVKTDNNFLFEVQEDGRWLVDDGKTNHFVYTEFVNAAYFNIGKQWEKIGLQTGLRAEHTTSEGNSITLDQVVPRQYLSLFPTMFLNQKINDKNSIRYSYSRRIGRPNYQQLNPFLFFLDPYTFQRGNEYLNPQFTDNLELTYTFKNAINLSLGYAHTKDNMFDIIEQDDETRITYQTEKNLEKVENYSANLSFPVPVTKWWNMHNNISVYYARFRDSNVSGGVLDVGQAAYNFYTGSTFSLKKGWSAEANMWFNSPQALGIIRTTKPQYAVNVGAQKSFWEKKGKLKLNVNDLFLTSFFAGDIDYQNVDLKVTNRWTSRRATLTFTYNFGNQNVKASRRRSTATDDLKQRAGGNNN